MRSSDVVDRREPGAGGVLVIRMPRSLHARLRVAAARELVSLNQYVVALLAAGMGPAARDEVDEVPVP